MGVDLNDLQAFATVARADGFRDAARLAGVSASGLSEAVRRLEAKLGVRLLNRTTRSIAPTEAGARLLERLAPALGEVAAAVDVVNAFRDQPAGTLKLNVPATVARATAAAPDYLKACGRPQHPRDLLAHACLRGQFASGASPAWEFEQDGEVVRVDVAGPLVVRLGGAADLAVSAAVGGLGVIHLFEEWLRPHLDCCALEEVLTPWRQNFAGPFLYYPGRRHLPAPLRAFVDFIRG